MLSLRNESKLFSLRTLQLGALCDTDEAAACFCCLRLDLTVGFPGGYVNTPSPFVMFKLLHQSPRENTKEKMMNDKSLNYVRVSCWILAFDWSF